METARHIFGRDMRPASSSEGIHTNVFLRLDQFLTSVISQTSSITGMEKTHKTHPFGQTCILYFAMALVVHILSK